MRESTNATPTRPHWVVCWGLALFVGLLAACGGGAEVEATPTGAAATAPAEPGSNEPVRGQAAVEEIDILIMESFPVQVSVSARGSLPDGCTQIDEVISQRVDDTFRVAVTTLREPGACTQALVPFEENIPLDVEGLAAGTYTVSVNGVTGTFTLSVDNVAATEPATSGTTGAGAGVPGISGFVWHDLCSQTGATPDAITPAPDGCVVGPDGTLQADGIQDTGEPGIPSVAISLLAGDCTTAGAGEEITATTDDSGSYRFEAVSADTYCVFLDTASEANVAALEEGTITFPTNNGVATNSVTVTLDEGAALEDVNFGFDFRFLPVAEAAADCANSFEFLLDLTVPDDTVFPPGAEFEAAWRLRNNGTCPWSEEYGVAFVNGDPMGITGTVPIETTVAPGQTVDLSVDLVAPEAPGTYRSNWQLATADGTVFGVNGQAEDSFWVQIVVEEGAAVAGPPSPGSGSITGVVWDDVCFLTNGTASRSCVETEEGSGFYRGNGTFDANEVGIAGLTVVLGRGACPPGGIIAVADRLDTAITAEDGTYSFEGLDADIYCVSIDALSAENVDILIPGNWTWPAPGTGRQGIRLAGGEQREDVDFGWDHQE